eukprot:scaffold1988_cov255-Pinguiococcus_pyrenoidosus.AAC.5
MIGRESTRAGARLLGPLRLGFAVGSKLVLGCWRTGGRGVLVLISNHVLAGLESSPRHPQAQGEVWQEGRLLQDRRADL